MQTERYKMKEPRKATEEEVRSAQIRSFKLLLSSLFGMLGMQTEPIAPGQEDSNEGKVLFRYQVKSRIGKTSMAHEMSYETLLDNDKWEEELKRIMAEDLLVLVSEAYRKHCNRRTRPSVIS